jgi:hypothetical protein
MMRNKLMIYIYVKGMGLIVAVKLENVARNYYVVKVMIF